MLLFWSLAAAMVLAALAFIAWPLWRARPGRDAVSADEVDVTLYHRRREELAEDYRNGLIDDDELQRARDELDRQLLTDTAQPETGAAPGTGGPRNRWPMLLAGLAVPLIAVSLYLEIGRHGALGGTDDQATSAHDIRAMVEQLETRLQANPDNGEGWLMLGRSYAALGQPREAVRALSRAHRLLGDEPAVLVAYARVLAATRNPQSLAGRPARLLEQALANAPQHPQALWLSGVAAVQQGDFEQAAERWQSLLAQVPPDSEDARIIQRNLDAVRERLSAGSTASTAADDSATGEPSAPPAAAGSIEVTVQIADALRDRIGGDEPLFIFAKAVEGPPMPLAVVRRRAGELPVTVRLDDDDSMMPGRGLSGHKRITIIARIAEGGNATAQSGDLQSRPQIVTLSDTRSLSVTIDKIVP